MFREMRRIKQQLSNDECVRVLIEQRRGTLAVNGDDGYPYAVPVNYYYDEAENVIYLHGAMQGHKLDAIKRDDRVCFTVWDEGYREEGDWAYYVKSVVAFGRAEIVTDAAKATAALRALGMKYFPSEEEVEATMRRSGSKALVTAIRIEHMTGKLVHEK